MSLTLHISSPRALFHKLERDAYRALNSHSLVYKADHFLNFCITAHAMRDYFLEYKRITGRVEQARYHRAWNSNIAFLAVAEIANTVKHFTLRDGSGLRTPKTKEVTHGHTNAFRRVTDTDGVTRNYYGLIRDVYVTLSDGTCYTLDVFLEEVLRGWKSFLAEKGIRVKRLSTTSLVDTDDSRRIGRLTSA